MRKLIVTLLIGLISLTTAATCLARTYSNNNESSFSSLNRNYGLRSEVLATGLRAYDNAVRKGLVSNKHYLTIIDYSLPSTEKRLWVIDLHSREAVYWTYVSHGEFNGEDRVVQFSNAPGSRESSIGVYVTKNTYVGKHGVSLVLSGVDGKFNSNAERRGIVMHSAFYADPQVIHTLGRLGRSWGCPAISPTVAQPIINTIKDGSVLVAYYPYQPWLRESQFLA
jgi:hypothetical protein